MQDDHAYRRDTDKEAQHDKTFDKKTAHGRYVVNISRGQVNMVGAAVALILLTPHFGICAAGCQLNLFLIDIDSCGYIFGHQARR